MATKTKKKPATKTKPKAKNKAIQHCKKCGQRGHNSRRHKVKPLPKTKKPAKK